MKSVRFALCIENSDCEDLEKRKVYQILPDETATQEGYMRVIDESGEDYLYPESYFILVDLPRQAEEVLVAAN
ncbi:hypothetical protein C6502_07920 [Candidatus Poribacteria bacterium]|nr:MAG: hypothetical protein C6502_07920 [Candidatus Poribacteria bacterium]